MPDRVLAGEISPTPWNYSEGEQVRDAPESFCNSTDGSSKRPHMVIYHAEQGREW